MKWVIIDKDTLTKSIRGGQVESNLENGQAILRVNDSNESYLTAYKKYSAEEIHSMDLTSALKFKSFSSRSYKNQPFKAKFYEDGSKLYENVVGAMAMIPGNGVEVIRIQVPYDKCFFTEVEIINSFPCSTVNFEFQVSDGEGGFITIHKHGHAVNIGENVYRRKSDYEAQLNQSIYICAEITNADINPRCYGLNVTLHEAKL